MSIKGSLIFFQYFNMIIPENAAWLCSEKSIFEKNFEIIRFYSIEKKSLFLYVFSSSGLSLSRLLRFYIIFSLVPIKSLSHFASFLSSCRDVPVNMKSPTTRAFAYRCSCPWGSCIYDVRKK